MRTSTAAAAGPTLLGVPVVAYQPPKELAFNRRAQQKAMEHRKKPAAAKQQAALDANTAFLLRRAQRVAQERSSLPLATQGEECGAVSCLVFAFAVDLPVWRRRLGIFATDSKQLSHQVSAAHLLTLRTSGRPQETRATIGLGRVCVREGAGERVTRGERVWTLTAPAFACLFCWPSEAITNES